MKIMQKHVLILLLLIFITACATKTDREFTGRIVSINFIQGGFMRINRVRIETDSHIFIVHGSDANEISSVKKGSKTFVATYKY